jgi:hypothetical protein
MKELLDKIFNQSGGTYVGAATLVALIMAIVEFFANGYKAPVWFVAIPAGIYAFILVLFVLNKGTTYLMDSKYNSPPDQKPQ